MAERDVMLVAIEMDASGAIKSTEVLDTKFDKLGNTLRKGKKRAEGAAAAQKKLDKSIQGTTKSTTDNNVATIAKLQVMEAATSGLNQLISAQYKRIDADLAAGKITAEEAEELRKKVKQHEKLTGILETGIAMARLYTVAQVIGTAVMHKSTAATELNTKAVAKNNAVVATNPWIAIAVGLASVIAMLYIFERETGKITDGVRALNKELKDLVQFFVELGGIADNNPIRRLVESNSMKKLNDMTRLEVLGVG